MMMRIFHALLLLSASFCYVSAFLVPQLDRLIGYWPLDKRYRHIEMTGSSKAGNFRNLTADIFAKVQPRIAFDQGPFHVFETSMTASSEEDFMLRYDLNVANVPHFTAAFYYNMYNHAQGLPPYNTNGPATFFRIGNSTHYFEAGFQSNQVLVSSMPNKFPQPIWTSRDIGRGNWHFFAFVFDGKHFTMYDDTTCLLLNSNEPYRNQSVPVFDPVLQIGALRNKDRLASFFLFESALSQAEVAQLPCTAKLGRMSGDCDEGYYGLRRFYGPQYESLVTFNALDRFGSSPYLLATGTKPKRMSTYAFMPPSPSISYYITPLSPDTWIYEYQSPKLQFSPSFTLTGYIYATEPMQRSTMLMNWDNHFQLSTVECKQLNATFIDDNGKTTTALFNISNLIVRQNVHNFFALTYDRGSLRIFSLEQFVGEVAMEPLFNEPQHSTGDLKIGPMNVLSGGWSCVGLYRTILTDAEIEFAQCYCPDLERQFALSSMQLASMCQPDDYLFPVRLNDALVYMPLDKETQLGNILSSTWMISQDFGMTQEAVTVEGPFGVQDGAYSVSKRNQLGIIGTLPMIKGPFTLSFYFFKAYSKQLRTIMSLKHEDEPFFDIYVHEKGIQINETGGGSPVIFDIPNRQWFLFTMTYDNTTKQLVLRNSFDEAVKVVDGFYGVTYSSKFYAPLRITIGELEFEDAISCLMIDEKIWHESDLDQLKTSCQTKGQPPIVPRSTTVTMPTLVTDGTSDVVSTTTSEDPGTSTATSSTSEEPSSTDSIGTSTTTTSVPPSSTTTSCDLTKRTRSTSRTTPVATEGTTTKSSSSTRKMTTEMTTEDTNSSDSDEDDSTPDSVTADDDDGVLTNGKSAIFAKKMNFALFFVLASLVFGMVTEA